MKCSSEFGRVFRVVAAGCALGLGLVVSAPVAAGDTPDCSEQLEQIPRDGSVVEVINPWLTYGGSIVYGGVVDPDAEDVEFSGEARFDVEAMDGDSHVGIRLDETVAGDYQWRIGDGAQASFTVADSASVDEEPPTMGEGSVEASLELMVYEGFPVIFRRWELSFPQGSDDSTDAENMRYLVEFTWHDDEEGEESSKILVTPDVRGATEDPVVVELGGRADGCRHSEPNLPVTAEANLAVRAVDLAGNISLEAAEGEFEGVEAEKLAKAHDEFNVVIDNLGDVDESAADEGAEQATDEDEAEEDSGGCSATGGAPSGAWLGLVLLGLAIWRRS